MNNYFDKANYAFMFNLLRNAYVFLTSSVHSNMAFVGRLNDLQKDFLLLYKPSELPDNLFEESMFLLMCNSHDLADLLNEFLKKEV